LHKQIDELAEQVLRLGKQVKEEESKTENSLKKITEEQTRLYQEAISKKVVGSDENLKK
jgi:predicted  nucleic acid-binding Zn-ribbon protein